MLNFSKYYASAIALLAILTAYSSTPAHLFARKLAYEYRSYKRNQEKKVPLRRRPSDIAYEEGVPFENVAYNFPSEANQLHEYNSDLLTVTDLIYGCI